MNVVSDEVCVDVLICVYFMIVVICLVYEGVDFFGIGRWCCIGSVFSYFESFVCG